MTGEPELIVRRDGALGRLSLNRPAALGALTLGMCEAMTAALLEWRGDPGVTAVMIDHEGPRGFCAGGDIRMLADSAAVGGAAAFGFFHTEYRLNHLISVYPKPIIVVMDGIVMGGGVGISLPAPYRVATERTRFAMPETGIGLFPDVGGGWHLPRLHGRTGLWIVLTGARLEAADCELLGIATDVVASSRLPEMKAAIVREPEAIERILTEFEIDPGRAPIGALRDEIDRLFAGDSLEAVIAALEADGSDWARAQAEIMRPKSPLSSKVSFRLLAHETPASLAADLVTEYRLARRVVMQHDFTEGVRAVIVDKDNKPAWSPATPAGVTSALVAEMFAPLPADEEWTPLPGL
ncbi:MAG TPA: enoyl-CoA hydratase/isomerase family protein [Caulobacteraceae bacterium]|nr:enoyl-CoA hydratase/isomerase family protein [Caulobacteraceae bacterium]